MSRFLPLIIFMIWVSSPALGAWHGLDPWVGCAVFLGFYVGMVGGLAAWSRYVARASHFNFIQRRLRRFNAVVYASRILIPAWLAVGIFLLGWKGIVVGWLEQTSARVATGEPGVVDWVHAAVFDLDGIVVVAVSGGSGAAGAEHSHSVE